MLTLFEVSTIQDIVECHQRQCGYRISGARWFADSLIRYLLNKLRQEIALLINIHVNTILEYFSSRPSYTDPHLTHLTLTLP